MRKYLIGEWQKMVGVQAFEFIHRNITAWIFHILSGGLSACRESTAKTMPPESIFAVASTECRFPVRQNEDCGCVH